MRGSLSKLWVLVLPLAVVAGILYGVGADQPNRLAILSVGQGSCAVFQNKGRTVLIDAGPTSERMDAGLRLVAPALRRLGVGPIDLVLLTHPDLDHLGGLASVMSRHKVGRIVVPACFRGHPSLRSLPHSLLVFVERSAVMRVGDAVFQLEAPTLSAPANDNDGSLFVRITDGSSVAVISGDASMEVEMAMRPRLPRWSAQILVAGHHGSRTSTGAAWLRSVRPSILAISCGRNNSYGHPHESVLKAAASQGVQVLRTDRDGDLVFDVEPSGFVRVRAP